jgi:hypothetical protein
MGKFSLTDAFIAINGTALSDHANQCSIDDNADEIDYTSFSPNAYKQFGQGMKDATVNCTFFSDFAASSVHTILQPLYASGGTFAVRVKPTSAAASATNPSARMIARIYAYSGIAGKIGDAATFDAALRNAGTAGLVWGTVDTDL